MRQSSLFGPPSSSLGTEGGGSGSDPGSLRTVAPDDPSQLRVGTEVIHPDFGRGVIKERQGSPANPKLVVHFRQHGPKKLMLRHANLEIVLP